MRKLYPVIGFVVFALAFSGCDKIPFLQEYFPSSKEEAASPTTTPAAPTASIPKNVLVRVGSWSLTEAEFNEKLKNLKEVLPDFDINDSEAKKLVLEELVRQQLLVADAEAKGIGKEKNISQAVEEFRKTLLVQELAVKLTENIKATEQDAQDFYQENEDLFRDLMQWRIREIVVPTEEKAKELLIGLLQGQDFATVARLNSTSETAAKGGDTGLVSEFQDPQVQNAVLTLEIGGTSSVFKGAKGFYIIKLEEKKGGELKAFDEVQQELVEGLTAMKQQEALLAHIEELKSKADVFINENLLK